MPPYEGRYALANPGEGIAALSINNDINLFGIQTRINTTDTASFPDIRDEPVRLERPRLDEQWWKNLLMGVAVTAALAACAAVTIATCGAGAASFALVGAAIGACAVTTAVSVADAKTGKGRSTEDFVSQLLIGSGAGAAAGAAIYWAGPAAMQYAAAKAGGISMMAQGCVGEFAMYAPSMLKIMPYVPTIAKGATYFILGTNAVRKGNDVVTAITGEDLILDLAFQGNQEVYNDFSTAFDLLGDFIDAAPDVAPDPTPDADNTGKKPGNVPDDSSHTGSEPERPLNEAEQRLVDQAVNAENKYVDKANDAMNKQLDRSSSSAQGNSNTGNGGKGGGGSGNGSGNSGVVITNYSYESGSKTIPDKARDIAKQVKANNGAPPKGYKGGRTYKNIPLEDGAQKLPEGVNYKEYDINPYIKGQNRGTERIVIGDDGSVWYTNDHYYTFTQIE